MAHNRSPTKIRADAMAVPLSVFRGWHLEIDCGGACPRGRVYRVEALARAHGDRTVGDVVMRFRCQGCGRGPVSVVLVELLPRRRVPLIGRECKF